eukprot:6211125-Pleurochrysis_carterae.AAC.1
MVRLQLNVWCSACRNTCSKSLTMHWEAILHAKKSAEVPVIARNTGQARFKCPESVPARAATRYQSSMGILSERLI